MSNHSTIQVNPPLRIWGGIPILLPLIGIAAVLCSNSATPNDQRSLSKAAAGSAVDPASQLSRAFKAWQDQQQRVRSARFRWTYQAFKPAEQRRRFAEKPYMKKQLKLPVSELGESKIAQERVLAFDGSRTRYQQRGTVPVAGVTDYWDCEKTSVFGGQKVVTLIPNSAAMRHSEFHYTAADIQETNEEIGQANLIPFFLAFRMFDQPMQRLI